jgi:hypothetical protein
MSLASVNFRKKFPKAVIELPKYSFLDPQSFKIDGYFIGHNIGSVVLRIRDKNGVYVAKSTLDPKTVMAEVAFLQGWKKVGANVVEVLGLIKPKKDFPYAVAILEYIASETTKEEISKSKGKISMASAYKKMGNGLAVMHKAKGSGYGEVVDLKKLRARYKTFRAETKSLLTSERQENLIALKLLDKKDAHLILRAITIIEDDIRHGAKPSLIHSDPGLFNTFGIKSIKFFDPYPKISHPLEDLSVALVWASMENDPKRMRRAILSGYGLQNEHDERILAACLFLKILEKWEWWSQRGKNEKFALRWINKTKQLYQEAKDRLGRN